MNGGMNMTKQLKVGDRVARIKTRKVISKPTDNKDVLFKVFGIKGAIVIGEDNNIHSIDNLYYI